MSQRRERGLRRIVTVLIALLLPTLVFGKDSLLQRLDTADAGREWEAVGRLDIDGVGFCTGALIAPDIVLTAAHCLFDKESKALIEIGRASL